MSSREKKPRTHKFLDKHTILGSILLMGWGLFISSIIFGGIGGVLEKIHIPEEITIIIGAFVALLIHHWWFKPEYEGSLKGGNLKLGFKLASLMCIYYAFLIIQMLVWGEFRIPSVTSTLTAILAGTVEETVFRALPVSLMMRNWKGAKIPVVIAVSAICFGLTHGSNVLMGASIPMTVFQVLATCLMGVAFAAVYIRCGNILPVMIMHGLTDYICFMDAAQASENGVMIANLQVNNFIDLVVCVIMAAIGLYLVRPAKHEEIKSLWDKKWNRI